MPRFYCSLFLLFFHFAPIGAQSTTGTEFWLGYMENLNLLFNDDPEFAVIINTESPTTGAIEVPTTGLSIPFSVAAGSTEIFLPDALFYSETSEQIDNKGVRIVSTTPIRVQAYHYRIFFTESTNLLPITELGSNYLVTTMADEDGSDPSSFVIVSTADNTEIEIIPTTLTLGLRPAGVPFTITLNEGQNYQVQAAGELTGTSIRSLTGNPIAVFAGARQANIFTPSCPAGAADSHVWDQSVPLEDWSDLYYFVPFAGQDGDRIRIVAANDNTEVYFDCDQVATLDTGEFFDAHLEVATVISSTGSISVSQYNNSFMCEPQELGDPNGLSYLPASFQGTNFRWYASDRGASEGAPQFAAHWITIVGPEENFGGLTLDGTLVTNTQAFPGDPDWRYAQVNVGEGEHQLLAQAGLQAYAYGLGFADAYTNNLGYGFIEPQEYTCLEIEREGILCVDSLQTFTYTSNLNLVDFVWSFGDDSGSIEEFPVHSYDEPGEYEVNLTATAVDGTIVNASLNFIVVDCENDPCAGQNAEINLASNGNNCAFYLQTFEFTANFDPVSVSWDFGDGTSPVDEPMPEHFFPAAGNYTVTLNLENAIGCIFTEILEVNIIQCQPCTGESIPDITITGDLCAGATLTFDPNYEAAGIPLIMTDWVFSDGQLFNSEIVNVSFSEPGIYTVFYTAMNVEGCFFDNALDFVIEDCNNPCDNLPSLTIDAPQSQICVLSAEEFFAITDAELVSYEWYVNEELRSSLSTLTYSFVLTGPQLITLNAIDINGCEYTAFYKLFVEDCQTDCPDLSITDVVIDGDLCVDSSFSITIEAESEEQNFTLWTLSQTELIFDETLEDLSFSTPGIYTFDFLTFAGPSCVIDSTITVNIVDCSVDCSLFQLDGFSIDGELCTGSPISITPLIESELSLSLWTLPSGVTTTDFSLQDLTFDTPGPAEFQLQLISPDGCQIDTTFQLIIEACEADCSGFEVSDFVITGTNCVDSVLTISPVILQDFTELNWTLPDGSTSSDFTLSNISFSDPGNYTFQLQLSNAEGCQIDTTLQLVIEACAADCSDFELNGFNISGTNCVDSLISISPIFDQAFTELNWTLPDGSTRNDLELTDLSFPLPGEVDLALQINNAEGCNIDFTLQLTILDCTPAISCQVMFPNIFSPNGDNLNDRFQAFFAPVCEPVTYDLMIFNRWGNMVYESNSPGEGWDGTFNGEAHPAGVLVYICQLTFPNGVSQEIKGDVTLIR